jgi:hypothetical protein
MPRYRDSARRPPFCHFASPQALPLHATPLPAGAPQVRAPAAGQRPRAAAAPLKETGPRKDSRGHPGGGAVGGVAGLVLDRGARAGPGAAARRGGPGPRRGAPRCQWGPPRGARTRLMGVGERQQGWSGGRRAPGRPQKCNGWSKPGERPRRQNPPRARCRAARISKPGALPDLQTPPTAPITPPTTTASGRRAPRAPRLIPPAAPAADEGKHGGRRGRRGPARGAEAAARPGSSPGPAGFGGPAGPAAARAAGRGPP